MANIRNDVDVTQDMYADYERLRRDYVGKKLRKETVETMLELCGLGKSARVFSLAFKYRILLKGGYGRGTYYMVSKDIVPYSNFTELEKDYYNGRKPEPRKPEAKVEEKETGRVELNEAYCLRYLKERGYMCFKLTPNLLKLEQAFTPQFLLENCDAELK